MPQSERDRWEDGFWVTALAICLLSTGYRLMGSAAWQRVLDLTPGGRATILAAILTAGFGALVALVARPAWSWLPLYLASAWCFAVAAFQLYSALKDPAGPLGFFAWGYASWQLLKHASRPIA